MNDVVGYTGRYFRRRIALNWQQHLLEKLA